MRIAPSNVRIGGEPENIYSHGVFRILTQLRHQPGTQTWPQSDRCLWLLMGFETMA